MSAKSDTPLCEAFERQHNYVGDSEYGKFARSLERDRAKLVEALAELTRCMEGYLAPGSCQISLWDAKDKSSKARALLTELEERK